MKKFILIVCICSFYLGACTAIFPQVESQPTQAISEQATPSVTQAEVTTASPTVVQSVTPITLTKTSTPTPTPSSTITPVPPTPTPTQAACMLAGGRVEVNEITTILLPKSLIYRIYLPPCYDEEPDRSYPVLYLIHGQTYTDDQWDRLGAPKTADQLIAAGTVAPFIIVMPRDRVWLEPTEDKFGLAVEQTLVPWIDEHYRTIPDREHRAIGGLSRGAAWAVDIGLSHWEMFSAVGVHSGFVFYTDVQPLYLWLYNTPEGMIPRIYMDVSDRDKPEITKSALWLESLLTSFGIPHEWNMYVGEHEEAYWHAHVEDYLRWYTQDWGK